MKITHEEVVVFAIVLQQYLDTWPDENGGAAAAYNSPDDSWLGQAVAILRRLQREIFWHNNIPDYDQKWADFNSDC